MTVLHQLRMRPWLLALCAAALLSACGSPAIREAERLSQAGQHEAALERLEQGITEEGNPNDTRLRGALAKQRDAVVAHLTLLADAARSEGRTADLEAIVQRLAKASPQHPRLFAYQADLKRIQRHQRLLDEASKAYADKRFEASEAALRAVLTEDSSNRNARQLLARIEEQRESQTRKQATVQLATAAHNITLEFRDASLRTVFEALARAANINFVFDRDVRPDAKVTLFLRNTTVDESLRIILGTQQLGFKMLNESTVLVFPNTTQKQRDLLDTVTRTFYLSNADPKQVQNLIRTVAKSRDIFIDERLNMVVVRDTPEVIRLVERLVQNVDLPDPEVMLSLEVLEVSSKRLNQIGLHWPETANYGDPSSTVATLSSRAGLSWSVANPLAIATLKGSTGSANLLANPQIRARNREKAKVVIGDKLPVFTTTTTSNGTISNTVQITYQDVGLKLDVEPSVQLDNDVIIKLALEVSSITAEVTGPYNAKAYQVGTRQATTSLRLRDGETQILAGLIKDDESHSSAGLPGLHELPIAGRLFGTGSDSHDKTEIVLLITPHVVRNLVQPSVSSPFLSGTEAQPGIPSMILPQPKSKGSEPVALGSVGMGTGQGAGSTATPKLSDLPGQPRLTGPEEVMLGSSFQVTVRNPGKTPLHTGVSFDHNLLELASGINGNVSIDVPPQGMESVTLRAKAGVSPTETQIALEATGQVWALKLRDPNAPPVDPNEVVDQDQPPADQPPPNEPPPPQDR
jgi:general secretion pathway protein D